MASASDKIIAAARKYLGCQEVPLGSNDGPCVHHIQESTGAYGVAWCGSFCKRAYLDAGVDDDGILSASTWQSVENAKAKGALIPAPIPGCVIVWRPGPNGHMEVVEKHVSTNTVLDVGGNVSDSVKEGYRDTTGAYFIAPKALRNPPPPVYVTTYAWQDLDAKPVRHGLYAAIASREHAVALWVAQHGDPGHVRRHVLSITVNGKLVTRWTFFTGERALSPDFPTKAARDADLAKVRIQRPGHSFRTTSRKVQQS